jgi:sugar/nucleoside kinase (ribokinase family)
MSERGSQTALVIGALARDFIAGRPDSVPGGVVLHAGLALARLGAHVRIVTRVHVDDAAPLLAPLTAEGVEAHALPSAHTTTYRLDYRGAVDAHELEQASDTLEPEDIPHDWLTADVIQLGPLHRADLSPALPGVLRGLVGLDIQGLVREAGPQGTREGPNPKLGVYLEQVDIVQASEPELRAVLKGESPERFARRHGLRELLVTQGARGVTVIAGRETIEVAAVPAQGSETVGAGDVFFAAYLFLRARGRLPVEAARGACAVVAAKIDHGLVPRGMRAEDLCEA